MVFQTKKQFLIIINPLAILKDFFCRYFSYQFQQALTEKSKPSEAPILSLEEAIEPMRSISFSVQRKLLHKMFTLAVCAAPDDEIDNFTAKELSPFYLALCETLENLEKLKNKTAT